MVGVVEDVQPDVEQAVCLAVGDSPSDLAVVRQRVRELLTGHPADLVADAVLVADALAGNSRDHGDAPRVVRLMLLGGGASLRIEAEDGSVFALPVVRGWSGSNGLGMVVVSQVAASWGVDREAGRKTVWAELALVGSSDSAETLTGSAAR